MEKRRAQIPLVCHGHSRPIVDLGYSPITEDGYFLISASKDGKPMLRNGETGDWIGTFEGHKGAVWMACLDPSALHAATASADFTARVWDALTGDEKHVFQHKHIVRNCDFSPSGKLLLTGGFEKLLRIFDLEQPDSDPTTVDASAFGNIRVALWHGNEQTILSAFGETNGVSVWDLRSKSVVRVLDTSSACTSIEISRDGKFITTAEGNEVKFWDAHSYELVKKYTMPRPVESASLYPATGRFVAGGDDMWVRLFDFDNGEEIECNKGHHGPIHCVRFSPGGESYASGSEDGTIRIWRTVVNASEEGLEPRSQPFPELSAATQKPTPTRVGVDEVVKKVEGFKVSSENNPGKPIHFR